MSGSMPRRAVPLAVSLLAHAGAAAAFFAMPLCAGPDASPALEHSRGEPLRPVQVAFVPMRPRSRDDAPAPPPPEPESPPDEKRLLPPRAPAGAMPPPPIPLPPDARPRMDPSAAAPVTPRDSPPPSTPWPDPSAASGPREPEPQPADVWCDPLPAPAPVKRAPEAPRTEPNGEARRTGLPTGAEVLDLPAPQYPQQSRRLGEEGLVLLEVEVLPDGRAGWVRVVQAPEYPRLVAAAIEAVRKARFKPATAEGVPVRSLVEIPVRFRLE